MLDLARRYLETDWVSEYQRLWAIFNHWFVAHTGPTQDRQAIEALKSEAQLSEWLNRRMHATVYPRPDTIREGFGGSYPRFATDNEISRFFRGISQSTTVEARVSRPWRVGTDARVRPSCAIVLEPTCFAKAYRLHAQILQEGIADFHLTLHQTLPLLGIESTGCCFYRSTAPRTTNDSDNAYAQQFLQLLRTTPETQELAHLADTPTPTTLTNDVVESLYNLRNVAVHGSLDFLVASDNAAARAGFDLLDSLLRDVRDHW